MARVPVSRGLRFSVLQRDRHTCQYCGRKAPETVLTVDHIIPVAAGGRTEADNLLAACVDCNSGKGASLVLKSPDNRELAVHLEALKERRKILRATVKAERAIERDCNDRAWIIGRAWCEAFGRTPKEGQTWSIDSRFFSAIKSLLIEFTLDELLEQVQSCATKWRGGYIRSEQDAIRYFCGTMRNIRAEKGGAP